MISSPQIGRASIELNPLRLVYSVLSDRNTTMRPVAQLADYVRAKRTPASADNPFITMQQQFSQAMVDALNLFRDCRDELVERTFHDGIWLALGSVRLRNPSIMMMRHGRGPAVAVHPLGRREGETAFEGTDCRW